MASSRAERLQLLSQSEDKVLREAHRVYRPMESQLPIHLATAHELVVSGGKRCLGGEQAIFDPVAGKWRRIDSIRGDWHVLAMDPATGKLVTAHASEPFVKGFGDIYRVRFSDGTDLMCTLNHRVVTSDGRWCSIRDAAAARASLLCPEACAAHQSTEAGMRPEKAGIRHPRQSRLSTGPRTFEQGSRHLATCISTVVGAAVHVQTRGPAVESCPPKRQGEQRSAPGSHQTRTSREPVERRPSFACCRCSCESAQGPLETNEVACLPAQTPDVLHLTGIATSSRVRCFAGYRRYGEQPRSWSAACQGILPSPSGAPGRTRSDWLQGDQEHAAARSQTCRSLDRPSRTGAWGRVGFHAGGQESRIASAISESSEKRTLAAVQSPQSSALPPRTAAEDPHETVAFASSHPLQFNVCSNARRVHITSVEFVRQDAIWDVTVPGFGNYWTGILNANSGKSTSVAMEFASRVLGIPIIGPDGNPLPLRWPVSTLDDPLTYWVIGINVEHIGKTIHRLLLEPGMRDSLRVIRDAVTGQWRIWNRATEAELKPMTKRAGPAIPPRLITDIAWHSAGQKQFSAIQLANGALIRAFPSSARTPGMGDSVHGIWINEDVQYPEYLGEWQDRLNDVDGWLMWDAFPQMQNEAIGDMIDRAEECQDDPDPPVQHVQLIYSENRFVTDAAKSRALGRMGSEDEIARRDRGERLRSNYMMYDFVPGIHVIGRNTEAPRPKNPTPFQILSWLYSHMGGMPPESTRYLSIDPSHTRTGILSVAVPPPEIEGVQIGQRAIVEWELVAERKLATEIAKLLKPKMGERVYRAFVMDKMKGQQTNANEGRNTFQVWADAFRQEGIKSEMTEHNFIPGLAAPLHCAQMVRALLGEMPGSMPRLMLLEGDTAATIREFNKYRKKVVLSHAGETILDEPANPRRYDLMAALQYIAAFLKPLMDRNQAYIPPEQAAAKATMWGWMKKLLGEDDDTPKQVHLGPGLAPAP